MEVPKYITGITREQLKAILEAANVTVGPGVKIDRKDGALRISVDEQMLKYWMRAFHDNGGFTCSYDSVNRISLTISGAH